MTQSTNLTKSLLANVDRRQFLGASLATAVGAAMQTPLAGAAESAAAAGGGTYNPEICAFIKFVQSLSYDEMAANIAAIGFDGIESTVRNKGHVLPERVKDDLPKQLEACRKHGIDITLMATDVTSVDQPYTEDVLRTAAGLGIKKYRMGFYRYDLDRSIPNPSVMVQLEAIRPQLKDLAALNRELGMTAVYQNHSGDNFVGAPLWDMRMLLEDHDVNDVGLAFDIRHATIEGGLSWPLDYDVMKPYIGAVFVKDFDWVGPKAQHVPLGEGRVDKKFFKMHRESGIDCPISLHVEYLGDGDAQQNLAALKRDLGVLKAWLQA